MCYFVDFSLQDANAAEEEWVEEWEEEEEEEQEQEECGGAGNPTDGALTATPVPMILPVPVLTSTPSAASGGLVSLVPSFLPHPSLLLQ